MRAATAPQPMRGRGIAMHMNVWGMCMCGAGKGPPPREPDPKTLTWTPSIAPPQVNQGTVVAVGPGRRTTSGELVAPAVKAGDKVLLPEYGGTQVKLDDDTSKE